MGIKYIEHVNGTATPDKIAVEYAVKDSAGNIIKDTYLKTWRPIKYGNTTLNDATTTLEFIAGSNISLSFSQGKLTIGNTYSYTHPTYDSASAAAVKVGRDGTGHVVIGNALTAADVGAAASDHTHTQLENSLTLLKSGTNPGNSYELIFQRGTLTDSYNDWRIQDREGFLRFDQRGSGSSDWSQQVYFNTSGTVYATAFSGNGASLTNLNASNISSGTISVDRLPSITSAKISDFTTAARSAISGTSPISYSSSTGAITHATALSAAVTSGLYKIAVDTYGHITGTAAVQSSDISGLESDPVFSASAAAGITSTDITNWNSKTSNTGTVIGSGLTAEYFVVGNGTVNVKISSMRPSTSSTTWSASSDVYVPTMKAISNYVTGLGYTSNTGTVIGSSLTANYFVVGNGTVNVKASSMQPTTSSTTWSTTSDVNVPTMKAISSYVTGLGYTTTATARTAISATSPISYNNSTGVITHATALSSAASSGLYKVAVNTYGHVTSATAVEKADITALGIPGSDTNDAVTQTATTTSAAYEVLFSATADNTTRTEGARKNNNLTYNPSTGNISTVIYTMMTGTTAKAQMAYDNTEEAIKFTFV